MYTTKLTQLIEAKVAGTESVAAPSAEEPGGKPAGPGRGVRRDLSSPRRVQVRRPRRDSR